MLLYDGLCGFCNGSVRFILRHERLRTLCFAPLQGDFARSILEHHPHLLSVDSLIIIEQHSTGSASILLRSDALLRVAEYLRGPWSWLRILRFIPRSLRDGIYDLFAANRYRFVPRYDACPLPPPEHRSRFLD